MESLGIRIQDKMISDQRVDDEALRDSAESCSLAVSPVMQTGSHPGRGSLRRELQNQPQQLTAPPSGPRRILAPPSFSPLRGEHGWSPDSSPVSHLSGTLPEGLVGDFSRS